MNPRMMVQPKMESVVSVSSVSIAPAASGTVASISIQIRIDRIFAFILILHRPMYIIMGLFYLNISHIIYLIGDGVFFYFLVV